VALSCRYLISNMAINAAQIWVFNALAECDEGLNPKRLLQGLKKSSICQRCLYTAATVAGGQRQVVWLEKYQNPILLFVVKFNAA